MSNKHDLARRKQNFLEREGYVSPSELALGELSKKFRHIVWRHFDEYDAWFNEKYRSIFAHDEHWTSFCYEFLMEVGEIPHDVAYAMHQTPLEFIRAQLLEAKSHEVLAFIEFSLRSPLFPDELSQQIRKAFEHAPNYFIDESAEPLIIASCSSEAAKEHLQQKLDNINRSGLTGAQQHLRKAAQALTQRNYDDSLRESIHAVASAARAIDSKAAKTLAPALKTLQEEIGIHPALNQAFKTLYGYTNEEEGIRHELVDQDKANVDFDEAMFMYGACVSFVDYLISKKRQIDGK